jgi:hypothetical protein
MSSWTKQTKIEKAHPPRVVYWPIPDDRPRALADLRSVRTSAWASATGS